MLVNVKEIPVNYLESYSMNSVMMFHDMNDNSNGNSFAFDIVVVVVS